MIDHAVLIAAAGLLPAMKARLAPEARDLATFTDTEALRALEVITTRRPNVVMLERKFAATPRGAALVNRIKADPSLVDTRIDIVSHDVATEETAAPSKPGPAAASATRNAAPPAQAAAHPQLDYRGTRRAQRFGMPDTAEILVDGNRGTLVDLSTCGAQILTAGVLKPNQRVRIAIADGEATTRCAATVVWASFEIPKGTGPRYRAGLEFVEPDVKAIEAYIQRRNKV